MLKSVAAAAMLAFAAAPAAAAPEDAALNQVYEIVARGKAAGDADLALSAFAADVLAIDARPGPALAGAAFHGRFREMAARIRSDDVRVTADYRVESRIVAGDVALDAGFMRQRLRRAADGREMVQYARFLVTFRRGPDGAWRIAGDASMPATEAAWDAVPRGEGLRFDG